MQIDQVDLSLVRTPLVVLVMPHNFVVHPRASKSFWAGPCNPRNVTLVGRHESISSILPYSFNAALAIALDLRDKGEATHIAMLHSDIEAEPWWIDKLWSVMWKGNFSVVSAVVPIKEHNRQRTSTAVGSTKSLYGFVRNVTMDDVAKLPRTFTTKHVAQTDDEVLMINTGCWLGDLRIPFWDDCDGKGTPFAFNQICRMRRDEDGKHLAEQQSEDWEWSHRMHAAGVRYAATRAVRARHYGADFWGNDEFTEEDRRKASPILT